MLASTRHGGAPTEVVTVTDSSTDETEDVVDEPAQRDLDGNPTGQATLNIDEPEEDDD